MALSDAMGWIGEHTVLIAFLLVIGIVLWKFIIQPIMNEGKPLDSDDKDSFENQMKDMMDETSKMTSDIIEPHSSAPML